MLKKIFLPVMAGCLLILSVSTLLGQSSEEENFGVKYYDLWFELDPANKVFRSQQKVTLTNLAGKNLSYLAFILNSTLIVDDIKMREKKDLSVEFYTYPGQSIEEELTGLPAARGKGAPIAGCLFDKERETPGDDQK